VTTCPKNNKFHNRGAATIRRWHPAQPTNAQFLKLENQLCPKVFLEVSVYFMEFIILKNALLIDVLQATKSPQERTPQYFNSLCYTKILSCNSWKNIKINTLPYIVTKLQKKQYIHIRACMRAHIRARAHMCAYRFWCNIVTNELSLYGVCSYAVTNGDP
jgi:hypothetical protein